ncbi:hypothetical protein GN958_ATG06190 [Phytophthora infestans]|uniref:RxLR effector PexRD54 WY domain-containing protein n=1 Tax=Phytophthora infestans TaxID=4787 RepID=A0A8S9UVI2_PHYIN|nr:hypothetical protein GN958_ATG06190 [Phytophthora infestans]
MHFIYRVVLVLAAFALFKVDSISAGVTFNVEHLTIPRFTRPVEENLIKRQLRVMDDNERGFPSGPSLEKIEAMFQSLTNKITTKSKPSQRDVPDEKLPQLLGAAKPVNKAVEAAGRLKTLQTQKWLDEGKSTQEVFQLLELNKFMVPNFKKIEGTVFGLPDFNTWVNYVDDFNAKNPTKKESMIPTLRTIYSDEGLTRALELAKTYSTTNALATKLRKEQIQRWLDDAQTPKYVFEMFMIDDKVDGLLTNPRFIAWTKYVDDFNLQNPTSRASMEPPIAAHYGDDAVFAMLEAAKKVQLTENVASRLQAEQIKRLLNSNRSPEYVFKAFNLHETGDNLLSTPMFKTWFNYLESFNKKNTDKETLLAPIHRYYHDHGVAKIVAEGMKNPSTVELSKQLQIQRYKRWLHAERPPRDAFNTFILEKPGADVIIRYNERLDGKLYQVRLNKVSDGLLSSPEFQLWSKYLDDWNTKYPDQKQSMAKIFQALFTEDALAKMIMAARNNPSTQKIASLLENAFAKV